MNDRARRVEHKTELRAVLGTMALATILVAGSFLLQSRIGLNLADEGFLWYGAQRTLQGELPIRDFQAYDPGRYFWSAAWLALFGDGILGLRLSNAIFQSIGLFFGLLSAKRIVRSPWVLGLVGVLLVAWMFPRYKLFEHSLAMAAVYFACYLIEKPLPKKHLVPGIFVGLAAFFGRNYGAYNLVSFSFLIIYLYFQVPRYSLFKNYAWFALGVLAGYSPMIVLVLAAPGYWEAFLESVRFLFEYGATNIPLPVPWPWRVSLDNSLSLADFHRLAVGLGFLVVPVFYAGALAIILRRGGAPEDRRPPLLIAAVFVGVAYVHHAFVRADIEHFATVVHPFLLGLIALPTAFNGKLSRYAKRLVIATICTLTIFAILPKSPFVDRLLARPGAFVEREVFGDRLWIRASQAKSIEVLERFVTDHVAPGEGLLIVPHFPGLYAGLRRPSPWWEIYFLFPRSPDWQRDMIRALEDNNVDWIVFRDSTVDGRDDLRFPNTHPMVWEYMTSNFAEFPLEGLPKIYRILRRTADTGSAR